AAMGDPLGEEYDDPDNASVVRLYLTGVDPDGPADLQAILERRMFAMPYVGARIGDEDYPRLDPADPDERGILIAGEHPEWPDLRRDPPCEGEAEGVTPPTPAPRHPRDDREPALGRRAARGMASGPAAPRDRRGPP